MATQDIPAEVEFEKFILSSCFLKDGKNACKIIPQLSSDDFYRPEHKICYKAIVKITAKNGVADPISFLEELRDSGKMDTVTIDLAFALMDIAFTTAYDELYIQKIKERSIQREIIRLSEVVGKYAREGKDPAAVIKQISELNAEKEALHSGAALKTFQNEADYYNNCVEDDRNKRREFSERKTGFENIDAVQTFAPALWIVAALPGQGKTDFCLQLADYCADQGENVLYVSLELSEGELRARCDARELYRRDFMANLSAADIYNGATCHTLNQIVEERKKSTRNFAITTIVASVENLTYEIERYCAKVSKPPIVVVDYLQCLPIDGDRRESIGRNAYALKRLQQNTNSTLIAVSSVNRVNYSSPFSLEAVKESGDIDFAADLIAGLQPYCANNYTGAPAKDRALFAEAMLKYPREMEFKVVKNRGGKFYSAYFFYYGGHSYFEPCEATDFSVEGPPECAGNRKRNNDDDDE